MNKKQRFIQLGWDLIKHKIYYYEFFDAKISDYEFDQLEVEYRKLAKELNLPPSVSDMVELDYSRPSVQNVLHKLRGGDVTNIQYNQIKEIKCGSNKTDSKTRKRTKRVNTKKPKAKKVSRND